ncbi:MAG: RdgB/HAM1 family non-canonical purine NTP pyrophosphatase [Clostridia bacterium]|mgnify:CR=1 FL=1|jgi:XTP/dITP diphosphohydrolase|nr:RdgB/HAM1 family non-canonical purine NTP pyrophosphatase [Clostridia bacterium]MBT7123516.1 RdgB/HAM1 family non-canonical purine NTP pyrophosphatase [Clostridia bacterium]
MSKLIIGTNNAHKVVEIKAILGAHYDEILSLEEAGIDLDVLEDGDTFEANAIKKAREASLLTNCDTLADDSGLCVDALGGVPGIFSARYAGQDADYRDNNAKLICEMKGILDRSAKFVCVMALVHSGEVITTRGETLGSITEDLRVGGGFGYDPIFWSNELRKTFGQASADEKNKVSHRYRALAALKEKLEL